MSDSEETCVESEVQDQGMEETVDKAKAQNFKTFATDDEDKEPEAIPKIPAYVTCRLCSSVYKRVVKTPCCGYWACRACAVKQVTKLKKCWNKECGKPVATADLENDEKRKNVEKYHQWEEGLKTGDLLKCSVCDEICQRGITMSCCRIAACRGCAVKKLTAKRECWNETCAAIGITSDKLENDELLRTAIKHFKEKGVMDVGHAKKIATSRSKVRHLRYMASLRYMARVRRQPPKNKKDKKKADKRPTPAEKPTKKKTKPVNKKKTSGKKQDKKKKTMVKRPGGSQMYGRQKNLRQPGVYSYINSAHE